MAGPFSGLPPIMMILKQVSGVERSGALATHDERLAAIAAAAADVLRRTPYHVVCAGKMRPPRSGCPASRAGPRYGCYNEVRNRRVLVALAAAHAWRDFPGRADWPGPQPVASVTAARAAAAAALAVIVAFHRAEQPLMTQVGYGIGDISTAEKRQLAAGRDAATPRWPVSGWGRVAAAAWRGRCAVFTDFLGPVLRDCAQSVTYLPDADAADSASRLSDIAFRTCLADLEGPVDLVARGLAALWFERDLTRLAGTLPRDVESGESRWRPWPGGEPTREPRRTPTRSWSGSCCRRARCTSGASGRHAGPSRSGRTWWRPGPRTLAPRGTTCSGLAMPRATWGWPPSGTATG